MDHELAGKAVLVTGGTGALGTAVVRAFADAGAQVTASWVRERERDTLREALGDPANLSFERADVTDPKAVAALCVAASPGGRLDVLAHLVGGFAFAPIEETTPETWRRMVALNATSTFLCVREAVRLMRPHRRGRIVTVAAVPAVERGAAKMTAYTASKAAVLKLTQSLAREVVRDGITVNTVAPSIIDTPANRAAMPDADRSTWLPPEAIARVILWLSGESAGIVTGSAVMLSRG